MKKHPWMIWVVAVGLGVGCSPLEKGPKRTPSVAVQTSTPAPLHKAALQPKLAGLQLPFIANHGQTDEQVRFYAPTFGGTLFVTQRGEMVYALPADPVPSSKSGFPSQWAVASPSTVFNPQSVAHLPPPSGGTLQSSRGVVLREELVGGRVQVVTGEGQGPTTVNIFRGKDPAKWQRHLPTYESVSLGEAYAGVTVKLKAYGQTVEKLFYVQPHAKPEQIRVKLQGGQRLKVTEAGELEVETTLGAVRFSKPLAYQETAGQKQWIEVAYAVTGQEYGFSVGAYDQSKELVIDPILAATFLGGSADDAANALALDAAGNVYVAGRTSSIDFPGITTGSADSTFASGEAFVAKLDASLTTILAATFLGGSEGDGASALALDGTGNVYIAGMTNSADFPGITAASADSTFADLREGFIAKLDTGLTTILAATFLGGSGLFSPAADIDGASALALDAAGNVYVAGFTTSADFPGITAASADSTFAGLQEGFIAKLDTGLSTLLAATFLGGSGSGSSSFPNIPVDLDIAYALALDAAGNVYVAGQTTSNDFAAIFLSSSGAFVAKLDADLTTILAATFIGAGLSSPANPDVAYALALDTAGNVYVAGFTGNTFFPGIDADSADSTFASGEAFVAKLNAGLTTILAATFLGGSSFEAASSLTLDSTGTVYVAGRTQSTDLPGINAGAADSSFAGLTEAFVVRLNADLTNILAATLVGGGDNDEANALALDNTGTVYVAGTTQSVDFPVDVGSADPTFAGSDEAFVVRLDTGLSTGCGNERIDLGEECDDGNRTSLDGCSALCVIEFCGDGVAQRALGEECDDGNNIDGDGCSAFCLAEENLLEKLKDLVDSCAICPPEVIDALLDKVNLAIKHVRKGLNRPAANALEQFIKRTERFVESEDLPAEEGQRFIEMAEEIIMQLEGRVIRR